MPDMNKRLCLIILYKKIMRDFLRRLIIIRVLVKVYLKMRRIIIHL